MYKPKPPIQVITGSILSVVRLWVLPVFLVKFVFNRGKSFLYTRARIGAGILAILLLAAGFAAIATVYHPTSTAAATANTVNFQARLMTAGGAIVSDGSYNVEFKLYNASSSSGSAQGSCTGDANCLWTETRTGASTVIVSNGYLTVNLGSVTALPSNIWGQQLWLSMRIGGTGAPSWDGEMSPRLLLTAVPAAYSLTQYNSATTFSSSLTLQAPTGGNQTFDIQDQTAAGTYHLCIQNSAACGFAPVSGTLSGSYINNATTVQSAASFYIQPTSGNVAATLKANGADTLDIQNVSGSVVASINSLGLINTNKALSVTIGTASDIGLTVKGASGQSASLLELQDSSGNVRAKFDQNGQLSLGGNLNFNQVSAPGAPTVADGGAGSLGAGTYYYVVTFVTGTGETNPGTVSSAVTVAASHQVSITSIPTGTSGLVTARKIYRGTSTNGPFNLVSTLSDNTTTSFTDNVTSLGGVANAINKTGGIITVNANPVLTVSTGSDFNIFLGLQSANSNTTGYSNTALGGQALYLNTTGYLNTAIGTWSLQANTTGYQNTATGVSVLFKNTTGMLNVGTGAGALYGNTTGSYNSAVGSLAAYGNNCGAGAGCAIYGITAQGYQAGYSLQTGSDYSTLIGYQSGQSLTTGQYDVSIGAYALQSATTANYNTALGYQALKLNTTGANNTGIGYDALLNTNGGSDNTAIGKGTMSNNTGSYNTGLGEAALNNNTGNNNTATGYSALLNNTSGSGNTASGYQAMQNNTTGSKNSTVGYQAGLGNLCGASCPVSGVTLQGYQAGYSLQTGSDYSTLIGYQSGYGITTGGNNVGLGYQTLMNNATGSDNVAIGNSALSNSSSSQNTAIGSQALNNTSTGNHNSALGYSVLNQNTTGSNNTAMGYQAAIGIGCSGGAGCNVNGVTVQGYQAGYSLQTGSDYSTLIGYQSGQSISTASGSVAVGALSLSHTTTGNNNTAVGYAAVQNNTTGTQNTALGYYSLNANTTGNNNTAVGLNSLAFNTTGGANTGLGYLALYNNSTASGNTAVGNGSLQRVTDGGNNTATGMYSLFNLKTLSGSISATANNGGKAQFTTGSTTGMTAGMAVTISGTTSYNGTQTVQTVDSSTLFTVTAAYATADAAGSWSSTSPTTNTAIGYQAGIGSSNGYSASGNALFGYNTGYALQSNANYNTMMGYSAGSAVTTGAQNLLLGYNAGANITTGASNIIIGASINAASATGSNQLNIGNVLTGDLSAGTAQFKGQLTVGTASSTAGLLYFANAGGSNLVGLQAGSASAAYTLTLPTTGPSTGQCLQTDSVTATQLLFGACGGGGISLGTYSTSNTDAHGATLSAGVLTFQDASASAPGMVGTGSQTFAGNKTFSGATTVNNTLLVQPASDSTAVFQVKDSSGAGGNAILNVDTTNGTTTLRGASTANDTATLGAELATTPTCTGTNWTGTGPWTHTAGSTVALSCTPPASVTNGAYYQVVYTTGGSPTASENVNARVGSNGGAQVYGNVTAETDVIQAGSTGGLTFVPSTNWNGTISSISLKLLTISKTTLSVNNSDNTTNLEVRSGGSSNYNVFLGLQAGQSNLHTSSNTGQWNTAVGDLSMANNTTGYWNAAVGGSALQYNTTGYYDSAFGVNTLYLNTIGHDNAAVGYNTLYNNVSGSNNTALGNSALSSNYSGSNNTALGYYAGNYDSGTFFATGTALQNATAIGAYAQVQSNNSIVLGSIDIATNVGIGTTIPLNTFSVSPIDYSTGTAGTNGAATTTVTGSGTSWTSAMIGEQFIFQDGQTGTITAVASATSLTLSASVTETGITQHYRIHHIGFQVKSDGTAYLQQSSATAFQVQNTSGNSALTVDTSNSQTILQGLNSDASIGAELLSGNCSGTNWSGTGSGPYSHASGSTAVLTCTITGGVTTGATYQVSYNASLSSQSTTIRAAIGGTNGGAVAGSGVVTQLITAAGTSNPTFTISSATDTGSLNGISFKLVTLSNAVLKVQNSSSVADLEVRASGTTSNTFVGLQAGQSNTTGSNITAFGASALKNNTTGTSNTAFGALALQSNSNGTQNTAVGTNALRDNILGTTNTAIGNATLTFNQGSNNTAVGGSALVANTSGSSNVAVGASALTANTTGIQNTALGYQAGSGITTGNSNLLLGYNSGANITTGSSNIVIGSVNAASATGSNQLQIGNILQGDMTSSAMTLGITALTTIQPAANMTNGQIGVTQTATFANATASGTIIGYQQNITVSSSTAATNKGFDLNITDNSTTTAHSNKGLTVTLSGSNTSQIQIGIESNVAKGIGIKATTTGASGTSAACGSQSATYAVAVCGYDNSGLSVNSAGVWGDSNGSYTTTAAARGGAGVFGLNGATGGGGSAVFYAGVKGEALQSSSGTGYTSAGILGVGQAGPGANAYGGYFTLTSNNNTANGAALYATTPTYSVAASGNGINAVNVLQAAGGGGQDASATTGVTAGNGAALSLVTGNGGAATGASGANIAGNAGTFAIQGGNGGAATSGTGGNGSSITITAGNGGNGSATNGNGGTITLQAGAGGAGAGTAGTIGSVIVKNAADSATAFQIQNAAGNVFLTADATNKQLVLGKPGASGINGTLVFNNATNANTVTLQSGATSGTYALTLPLAAPSTNQCLQTDTSTATQLVFGNCGASGYIQNQSATAQSANYYIQSAASGAVTAVIKGAVGQSTDILDVRNNFNSRLLSVDQNGAFIAQTQTNSTAGFMVADQNNVTVLNVDTQNYRLGILSGGPTARLDIANDTLSAATTDTAIYAHSKFTPTAGGSQVNAKFTINNVPTTTANNVTDGLFSITDASTLVNTLTGVSISVADTGTGAKPITGLSVDTSGTTNASALVTTALFKTKNSTTAFQVQNASSQQVLGVDTSTNKVLIGANSYTNGTLVVNSSGATGFVGLTVSSTAFTGYTLTLPNAAPTASSQCLQSSATFTTLTWGSCGGGGGGHVKSIVLSAEYAGAALDAASDTSCSSTNSGTMTSGFFKSASSPFTLHNYYNWTATSATTQCYDVVVKVPIPSDWSSWSGVGVGASTISFWGDSTTNASGAVDVFGGDGTQESTSYGTALTVGTASTWTTANLPSLTDAKYTAGSTSVTLRIRMNAKSSANFRIANITLNYMSAY